MRIGFAEGATSVEALNGWVEPPSPPRVLEPFAAHERDGQLGAIFRQMRAVVGLNEATLARKLGTDVSVIMDLEAGITDGLPPWRELTAIVERLAFVAGVDPSPILTRLMQLSSAAGVPRPVIASRGRHAAVQPPPHMQSGLVTVPAVMSAAAAGIAEAVTAPAIASGNVQRYHGPDRTVARAASVSAVRTHSRPVQGAAPSPSGSFLPDGTAQSRRRKVGRVAGPIVLLGLLLGGYFAIPHLPRFAYEAVSYFPRRLHEPVRNIIDLAVLHTAAAKDGLRWIDVGDPRLRKGDRQKSR